MTQVSPMWSPEPLAEAREAILALCRLISKLLDDKEKRNAEDVDVGAQLMKLPLANRYKSIRVHV